MSFAYGYSLNFSLAEKVLVRWVPVSAGPCTTPMKDELPYSCCTRVHVQSLKSVLALYIPLECYYTTFSHMCVINHSQHGKSCCQLFQWNSANYQQGKWRSEGWMRTWEHGPGNKPTFQHFYLSKVKKSSLQIRRKFTHLLTSHRNTKPTHNMKSYISSFWLLESVNFFSLP